MNYMMKELASRLLLWKRTKSKAILYHFTFDLILILKNFEVIKQL